MVYLAYHPIDRKSYVGSASDFEKRKRSHRQLAQAGRNSAFYDAIRRDGFEIFEWYVLSETADPQEMRNFEARFIYILRSDDPAFGYNKSSMLRSFRLSDAEAAASARVATARVFGRAA